MDGKGVTSAYVPGGPSGRCLTPMHEVTRNIATPPGWDASPLQGKFLDLKGWFSLATVSESEW